MEQTHYVAVLNVTSTTARINVTSDPQIATLNIGEEKKFELTDDNDYDLSVTLNDINATSLKADITILEISEEMPLTTTTVTTAHATTTIAPVVTTTIPIEIPQVVADYGIYILIIVIIIIAIVGWVYFHGHKKLPVGKPKPIHQ